MKNLLFLALLLAANGQQASPLANATRAAAPARPARQAEPFVFDEKNNLFDFHYAWSAEAAAVPQLARRLRKKMKKERAEFIALAERDRGNPDSLGYSSLSEYTTSGQSARLLSLRIDYGYRPGSVREDWGASVLLWDRLIAKEITSADLFTNTSDIDGHLTRRWCAALINGEDFEDCPGLDQVAIIPADKNGNGRFETLILVAPADVTYAHSEVELNITPDLIAALKGNYRASFEIGQPQ